MYNGLINVYKEPGFTSFDVVAKLRGILKQKKIGHTGTLDPNAEGVLLVCLGDGTKLVELLEDRSKEYECKMLLGTETDTEDTTGVITKTSPVNVSEEEIQNAILSFIGDYAQIPPMYSALKVNGKKMYELARQGIEIERKPRNIYIESITIKEIAIPYVTFTVSCSKGTYIRSLCRDIGIKLGCGATMEHLKRTRVGHFKVNDSLTLEEIEKLRDTNNLDTNIVSLEEIFRYYPSLYVKPDAAKYINNGNPLTADEVTVSANDSFDSVIGEAAQNPRGDNSKICKVYNTDKHFVALYQFNDEKKLYMPFKMFPNNI